MLATGHEAPPSWSERTPLYSEGDQPVVNVSWYDAIDYCQWLSEMVGRDYGLPSEAEGEKAARGTEGRIYPWGDRWEIGRCNSLQSGLEKTTPVHTYLQGASPYGVMDMAGNVAEWTRSLWGSNPGKPDFKYPYKANDGRENLAARRQVLRALRGGAFRDVRRHVRCASRDWDLPDDLNCDIGFRGVMHPSS